MLVGLCRWIHPASGHRCVLSLVFFEFLFLLPSFQITFDSDTNLYFLNSFFISVLMYQYIKVFEKVFTFEENESICTCSENLKVIDPMSVSYTCCKTTV